MKSYITLITLSLISSTALLQAGKNPENLTSEHVRRRLAKLEAQEKPETAERFTLIKGHLNELEGELNKPEKKMRDIILLNGLYKLERKRLVEAGVLTREAKVKQPAVVRVSAPVHFEAIEGIDLLRRTTRENPMTVAQLRELHEMATSNLNKLTISSMPEFSQLMGAWATCIDSLNPEPVAVRAQQSLPHPAEEDVPEEYIAFEETLLNLEEFSGSLSQLRGSLSNFERTRGCMQATEVIKALCIDEFDLKDALIILTRELVHNTEVKLQELGKQFSQSTDEISPDESNPTGYPRVNMVAYGMVQGHLDSMERMKKESLNSTLAQYPYVKPDVIKEFHEVLWNRAKALSKAEVREGDFSFNLTDPRAFNNFIGRDEHFKAMLEEYPTANPNDVRKYATALWILSQDLENPRLKERVLDLEIEKDWFALQKKRPSVWTYQSGELRQDGQSLLRKPTIEGWAAPIIVDKQQRTLFIDGWAANKGTGAASTVGAFYKGMYLGTIPVNIDSQDVSAHFSAQSIAGDYSKCRFRGTLDLKYVSLSDFNEADLEVMGLDDSDGYNVLAKVPVVFK